MPIADEKSKYVITIAERNWESDPVVAEKIKFSKDQKFEIDKKILFRNGLKCTAFIVGGAGAVNLESGKSLKKSAYPNKIIPGTVTSIYVCHREISIPCVGTRVEYKGHTVMSRWSCTFRIADIEKLIGEIESGDGEMIGETYFARMMRIKTNLDSVLQQTVKNILDIMPYGEENAEQFVLTHKERIEETLLEKSADGFSALGIMASAFDPI